MAEHTSGQSTTVLCYVGFPLLERTVAALVRRDFWLRSRSREGPAVLKEVGVNILGSLVIEISLEV